MSRKEIIEKYFKIINKQNQSVDFKQNPIQDKLDEIRDKLQRENKPIWILILKARKEGVSAKVIADWTVDCVNPKLKNINCVVISHQQEATKRLLKRAKYYIQNSKVPITTKTDNTNEISFPKTNSTFYIGTAGAKAFGRGDDVHRAHLSECAYYDAQFDWDGFIQAIPEGGEVIGETTANGIGNRFYQEWQRAKKGESKFYPLFLGWTDNPEYRIKNSLIQSNGELTEEEQILKERYHLDYEQIAWRREKIKEFNSVEIFKQEYPINDQEAFIFSGSPAFDTNKLSAYKPLQPRMGMFVDKGEQVIFEPNEKGWWRVWEHPEPGESYLGFCDPAEGKDPTEARDPDYSAIVLYSRPLFQVAELQQRISIRETAHQLALAGRYYNVAYLGWERNNAGHGITERMADIYPDERMYKYDDELLGWPENVRTRKILIDDFGELIKTHNITPRSEFAINECFSFVRNSDGKYEAQFGTHDDLVIAHAGIVQLFKARPLPNKNLVKQVREQREQSKKKGNAYFCD